MEGSHKSPAAEVVIGGGGVTIGGISIQSLEDRIRSLEALLENKPATQGREDVRTENNKGVVDPSSKPLVIDVDPDFSDAEDAELLRRHGEQIAEGDGMNREGGELNTEQTDRPMHIPTFTRISRDHLSLDTLDYYQLPYEIDQNPDYVLIKRWIPEREQEILWAHTRELRRKRHGNHGDIPGPRIEDAHGTSMLKAKIERLPYEDWKKSKNKEKSVLQVATEAVADTDSPDATLPIRLSIHSRHIWKGLRKTTKVDVQEHNNVMLPPWKFLVTYEKEIREYLERLEKYAQDKAKDEDEKKKQEDKAASSDANPEETSEEKATSTNTDAVHPKEKKTRFSDERLDFEHNSKPDGSVVVTRVKIPEPCRHCDAFHEEELDCVSEAISHWRCLIEFMDNDLKHIFDLRREIAAGTATEIAFADLWHLFNPGDLVITSKPRRAYRVFNINGGRPCLTNPAQYEKKPRVKPLKVECIFLNFETQGFIPVHETLQFTEFGGKLPIKNLPVTFLMRAVNLSALSVYPAQFEEDRDNVVSSLIKRGKRGLELFPYAHKYYRGISAVDGDELEGEIIIDIRCKEIARPPLSAPVGIFGHVEYDVREIAEGCVHLPPTNIEANAPPYMPDCRCWRVLDDFVVDTARAEEYKGDSNLLTVHAPIQQQGLSDDHLMLFGPDIRAYALKHSHWWSVYIDDIQDLDVFKPQHQFDNLVLPEGHEMLLRAVIKPWQDPGFPSRVDDEKSYMELSTRPREKALRILLHGTPGTGKSSTAAALAVLSSRPLYHIRCMDISDDAEDIQQHFRRAQQWNCVIVFHEADIFFARRDPRYPDRDLNACLSTLIDVLDIYNGIVVFCTRRVKAFDDTFLSRIHLALHFPKLGDSKERTMQVWLQSLGVKAGAVGKEALTPTVEEIMKIVETQWENGARWDARQIHNTLQTAKLMSSDGEKLDPALVSVVLNANNSFAEFHKASILEQEEEDKANMALGSGGKTTSDSWEMLSRRNTRQVLAED